MSSTPAQHAPSIRRTIALALFIVVLAHGASRAAAQTTVTLLRTARPPTATPVLAELADVRGDLGPRLARLRLDLSDREPGWCSLTPEDVREAINGALGESGSLVAIRGGPTDVLIATPAETQAESAQAQTEAHDEPTPVLDAATLAREPSVRGRVALALANALSVHPSDLRIRFDDRRGDLLDMLADGRIVDAQPTGRGERMPVSVKVFEGERLIASGTVRAEVEVRRTVAIVARQIARDQVLTLTDLASDHRWLAPDHTGIDAGLALGRQARRDLAPGEVVTSRDVERPLVIRRGDMVTVSVLSSTFVVETIARATHDAVAGETLELESLDDRSRTFTARADAPGRAVASTLDPSEKDTR